MHLTKRTYKPEFSQEELVKNAMETPVGLPKLSELSKGKDKVVIIASDHTRPVPSKVIIPYMLKEILLRHITKVQNFFQVSTL